MGLYSQLILDTSHLIFYEVVIQIGGNSKYPELFSEFMWR